MLLGGSVKDAFRYINKFIKGEETKRKKEQRRAGAKAKREMDKEQKKATRDQEIAVNIRLPNGQTAPMTLPKSETAGMLRTVAAKQLSMAKSKATTLSLTFQDLLISEKPRRLQRH